MYAESDAHDRTRMGNAIYMRVKQLGATPHQAGIILREGLDFHNPGRGL